MFEYTSLYFDDPPQPGRALDLWMNVSDPKPVALYFIHGGGWKMGHRDGMHALMHAFYRKGYSSASVSYRLGATVPQQLDDVRQGLRIFRKRLDAQEPGTRIVAIGSSAGAHLALLAGLAKPGACGDSDRHASVPVDGLIVISAPVTFEPWEEILPSIANSMQAAAGVPYAEDPGRFRALSPLNHLHAGGPPMLMLLAEREHIFPNELAEEFVRRAREMGISIEAKFYPKCEHGFFYDIKRPCQRAAFLDCVDFLEAQSGAAGELLPDDAKARLVSLKA